MIYLRYILIIYCCVCIFAVYSAEKPKSSSAALSSDILGYILAPFFHDKTQEIYTRSIKLNELVGVLNLALIYESIEPFAATEIMRFYHNPNNISNLLEQKPTFLTELPPFKERISQEFRDKIYKELPFTQNPNSLTTPFSIPPSTQCIVEHAFKMPLLRILQNSLTFVIHDEGRTVIIENANVHKINDIRHELQLPYTLMACGTNPWPLVVQTDKNIVQSLHLEYDTQKITRYKPSAQDLEILHNSNRALVRLSPNSVTQDILPNEIYKQMPSVYVPHKNERVWGLADKKNKLMCILINGQEQNGIVIRPTYLFVYPIIYCVDTIDRLISISLLGMKNNSAPYTKIAIILTTLKNAIEIRYGREPMKKENLLYRIKQIEAELQLSTVQRVTLLKIFPLIRTLYNEIMKRQEIKLELIDDE